MLSSPAQALAAPSIMVAWALVACGRSTPEPASAPASEAVDASPPDATSEPARAPRYLRASATQACLVVAGLPHCWGENVLGVFGAIGELCEDTRCVRAPTPIAALGRVRDLALDERHACVLDADGHVACLGADDLGQLGLADGARETCIRPGFEGFVGELDVDSLELTRTDTRTVPDSEIPCATRLGRMPDAPVAETVWAARGVTCIVTGDGALDCTGAGALRSLAMLPEQCGDYKDDCTHALVRIAERDVAEVGFGDNLACVLHGDGHVRCTSVIEGAFDGLDDVVELAVGRQFACVRRATGRVACAGWNALGAVGTGQVSDPTAHAVTSMRVIDRAHALAAGANHACAIVADGELWCWGANTLGQLGRGRFSVGEARPERVRDLPPVVQVVAGEAFTCALDRDDRVWCFGSDQYGQLGGAPGGVPCDTSTLSVTRTSSCLDHPGQVPWPFE